MTHIQGKKKDQESPLGDICQGQEFGFTLIEPTEDQLQRAVDEGFAHLVNGDFAWGTYDHIKSDKVCFLYLDNVEYLVAADGYDVKLVHEGNCKFKIEYK